MRAMKNSRSRERFCRKRCPLSNDTNLYLGTSSRWKQALCEQSIARRGPGLQSPRPCAPSASDRNRCKAAYVRGPRETGGVGRVSASHCRRSTIPVIGRWDRRAPAIVPEQTQCRSQARPAPRLSCLRFSGTDKSLKPFPKMPGSVRKHASAACGYAFVRGRIVNAPTFHEIV